MDDPLLEVSGLVAGYGGESVLQGVNLTIRPGEIIAVVGRNGVGNRAAALAEWRQLGAA